ncbi:unnamed protein product [Closterium sp. NIES-53]
MLESSQHGSEVDVDRGGAGLGGAADFGEAGEEGTNRAAAVKPTTKQSATRELTEEPTTREKSAGKPAEVQQDDEGSEAGDDGGDAEESTDSNVAEVQRGPRQSGRIRRPFDFYVPAAFTTAYDKVDDDLQYDDAKEDEDFPELDSDMHADPEHRWGISTMTVKEALASWKGKVVKAAMEEEIHSLVDMGTWELVEHPPGVNIMKNRWVLTTKYHIDDTVEREKARLVVKGFTQMCGADYDETYAPVSIYVTLRIFLSIVAILDLNDRSGVQAAEEPLRAEAVAATMLQGSGRRAAGRWLEEQPGRHGTLLQGRRRQGDLLGASLCRRLAHRWQQHGYAEGAKGAAGSRLRATGDLAGAEGYANKLRRQFLDEEQTGYTPKTPGLVDAYAELMFEDEEAQERQEEEYRQKFGSLQFAATTTRPDITFACSKLCSGLTMRSDQHWREVDHCLAYLANTRDTALEFGGGPETLELVSYVDADDAGNKQNRTRTSGYVFVYEGAAISWSSKRIKCVMLSSTESEYVAATKAGKEGRQLRFLLAEFRQLDVGKPTVLRVDNKSAISVAEGMGLTSNLKYMER